MLIEIDKFKATCYSYKMRKAIIAWVFVIFTLISQSDCRSRKQKDVLRLLRYPNNDQCFERNRMRRGLFDGLYFVPIEDRNPILNRNGIFSVFNGEHLQEAKKLFENLINAQDYDQFYEIAARARKQVNPGLFVFAFTTAVLHSRHTKDVILPALYEVNPYYFINGDVIKKALSSKENGTIIEVVHEEDLRYFTEDVGLNAYYYYINLMMPFWMNDSSKPIPQHRNGEYFFYFHQQLLARYNLERYSLGLGPTPSFNYEDPIKHGFISNLVYPDGKAFPSRENNVKIAYKDDLDLEFTKDSRKNAYTYIKSDERRLHDFLQQRNDNLEMLATLMGVNSETGSFNYPRTVLGNPMKSFDVPSALEHYETSLRDPMFWQMTKRMLYFYNSQRNLVDPNSKSYICHYTPCDNKVHYAEIIITDVSIDHLETYFEDFKVDLSNAMKDDCDYLDLKASMKRLNHEPFSYAITINAPRASPVFVKVFLGPKYDEKGMPINLRKNRFNFVEIDRFLYHQYDIISQKITRHSDRYKFYSEDRTGYQEFYNQIIDGFVYGAEYKIDELRKYYGFPRRLMLPKGSSNGTTFQLYAIASPSSYLESNGIMESEEYKYNYPFDRMANSDDDLLGSNTFMKDVVIYHH